MAEADGELVRRVLAGDRSAFESLVTAHTHRVRAVIGNVLGRDPSVVDDVAQEAFLHAYRSLGSLGEPAAFPSWLCVIARNEAVTWLRRNARVRTVGVEQVDSQPPREPDTAEAGPDLTPLRAALAGLSPSYREIIALKYEAALSYEQIADTLGMSVANVEKRLYRARQALLERMPPPTA